jgi:hypothetical protein
MMELRTSLYSHIPVLKTSAGMYKWSGARVDKNPETSGSEEDRMNSPKNVRFHNDVPVLSQFYIHKFLNATYEIRELIFEFGF